MMEVKTQVLMKSEQSFRKANSDIRRICEELESVAQIVGTMKSTEISRIKIRSIENDLEKLASSVSQLACFMEMANETYTKTEMRIEDRSHGPLFVLRRLPMQVFGNIEEIGQIDGFEAKALFKSTKW